MSHLFIVMSVFIFFCFYLVLMCDAEVVERIEFFAY